MVNIDNWIDHHATSVAILSTQNCYLRARPISDGICFRKWDRSAIFLLMPNSITLDGSELVRSWFEPDSVMEFGF